MEDDISYFNFHFELSGPIHQLLTFIGTLPSYSSPPSYLLEPLKSLLQTSSSNDTPLLNNQISSLLESLTELLVYPDLTLEILTFFRPCIIDLVSRSIHSIKTDIRITRAPSLSNTKRKVADLDENLEKNPVEDPSFPKEIEDKESIHLTSIKVDIPSLTYHERLSIAVSKIILGAPQVNPLITSYFLTHPSPLDRFLTTHVVSSFSVSDFHELLLCTYRLIVTLPDLKQIFPLHLLIPFLDHSSLWNESPTKTLLVHLISTTFGLSDQDKSIFIEKYRTNLNDEKASSSSIVSNQGDFFYLEHKNFLHSLQRRTLHSTPSYTSTPPIYMNASHLSAHVVNVCGILIPKENTTWMDSSLSSSPSISTDSLLDTPTTLKNLHDLALAVSLGSPVLLEGVPGAGKTSLVEELARRLHVPPSKVVKIHLGDQVDGKTLLGSYMTTHQAGAFVWSRGLLTRAVEEGWWVILEDWDMVSADIVSLLLPLIETRTLFIAQRGQRIYAHPKFQFFATCTLLLEEPRSFASNHPSNVHSNTSSSLSLRGTGKWVSLSLFTRVHVHALPKEEMVPILQARFPTFHDLANTLVTTYESMHRLFHDPSSRSSIGYSLRSISTRDLMKWAHRIQAQLSNFEPSSNDSLSLSSSPSSSNLEKLSFLDRVFLEAMDVFCHLLPNSVFKDRVVQRLQSSINISEERVAFFRFHYAPDLFNSGNSIVCGRITLPITSKSTLPITPLPSTFFTYTTHTKRLLEQVLTCVVMHEPVLLIGETGTGKTSMIQHVAHHLHKRLHVVNLSQQSDSSDLMGGFKPMTSSTQLEMLIESFLKLFASTFSIKKNSAFLNLIQTARERKKVDALFNLFQQAIQLANARFEKQESMKSPCSSSSSSSSSSLHSWTKGKSAWIEFANQVDQCRQWYALNKKKEKSILFQFVEGILVSSLRQGDWILLDEINLATPETLASLSGLLDKEGGLLMTERGGEENTLVPKHPEFRLFACMNPSTDIGKKDLPSGLRTRFTEIYVHSPDSDESDLKLLIASYLTNCIHTDPTLVHSVMEFYTQAKLMATTQLYDGAGFRPHFTLRTLTRALTFATDMVSRFGVRRALFEGLSLTFLTLLDLPSHAQLMTTLHRCILKDRPSQYLNVPVTPPTHPENFVRLDAYWLKKGNHHLQFNHNNKKKAPYILSASVKKNLIHLARSVMTQRYPVLIQGPTSSGKTSMIEYLAHLTGHTFVRVNNHAHTDLQEYLGCYVSNDQGQLIFKEGTLVTALRQGHWIVLDELNLAPTDVLEALNRLLDENRELFIPETQTWVHPHPSFMLFATQNPPSYGGRKLLSRAFRNRFLELHFDDLPDTELLQILSQRCALPPSYAKKMVQVYQTLRTRRQTSRIFDGKSSFITLRDLFRWADRRPSSYDELAIHGFMILGERVRQMEERQFILEVLQEVFKVQVDPVKFYASIFKAHAQALETSSFAHTVVWNESMQRLFALAYICQQHGEPVLLVGETGCGKTTVCQLISHLHKKSLTMVNCHQFSETSDFLGSQRPCRHVDEQSPLFEWQDGPLVVAMKQGHDFLLDEISLADDSVLERLNSLLEPSRTLLLAEKGGDAEHVVAHPDFRFFATMNPGGDYGKKELSPALRNRFTEIWTPPISSHQDRWSILHAHLKNKLPSALPMDISHTSLTSMEDVPSQLATRILEFIVWYEQTCEQHHHVNTLVSIRDLISWCQFVSATYPTWLHENAAIYHGACLVLLDGLKHPSLKEKALLELKQRTQYNDFFIDDLLIINNPTHFGIEPFLLTKVSSLSSSTATTTTVTTTMLTTSSISPSTTTLCKHSFHAPTAKLNLFRLLRAIFTTDKAILLEGSPGVGKTSVVSSLADILGQTLVRINLSEQTDLVDLFGSDLPVEGGEAGAFSWRDGLFLSAMKRGDWVLLDELNLASQSVLEGLNACLDHRGTVYIPELNQSFAKHPNFRVFGAQNPMEEGGGRRGLPKSFLNRFSCIHLEPLSTSDYFFILKTMFPTCNVTDEELHQMIQFNASMHQNTMVERNFGLIGAPWEFNLRDLIRWLELKSKYPSCSISSFLHLLYFHRLQTKQDIEFATQLWLEISNEPRLSIEKTSLDLVVTPLSVRLGLVDFPRSNGSDSQNLPLNELSIPNSMLSPLHSLLHCLDMGWMVMLNGPSESGKTYLARTAASLCGRSLVEFSVHKSVDAMELLGGFEQIDANRCWEELVRQLRKRTSILLPVLLKLGTLPSETQVLASYTQRSFPLGSLKLMELWIKQLHDISRLLSLPDSHELHVNLLNKYKKVQLDVTGKFEWVDGIVLEAIQTGQWLLLENANLCSPSVLDRLNPLFESNFNRRQLVMNERGMTKSGDFMVIEPHPEFRLIMTMNPIHGHISRALRNRGIEISLLPGQWVQDKRILRHVMVSNGIIDTTLQENLLAIITSSATSTPTTTTSPRQSVLSIAYAADLLQRGFPNDMVMRHRLLCSTSSNTQVTSIHLLNEETKNSNALFAPLHFPLHLQDSMASLMATKFSFVDSPVDKFFDEKFLQPALDWILFHPTSFSFCSNMVSWLEWREKQTIPSHFSILTFKHILIRLHSILLRTSFSTPLFVKSFLDYVKFLFLQEQATSNIKTLQPKFFNSIQRSFSSHFLPDYVLVPKPSQTEILLIPLLTSFDKSMMQSLHQVFDKHRTLELLFWTKSMFQKCFLDASLNLDLLDAHVTHLLKLTEHSDLFAPYHNALNTLQASYFGDMDVTRHIWARFHPWVVRSFALLEPVNQLESLPISQVTCQLLELISDALFNMYLGDVEHQIFLESDFPRLLKLVQTSGLITSIAENLDSEKHLVPNSLTTLKDQFTQMDHKYSQKSKLWLRAILLFNYLPQFLTDANIAVTFPTCLFASSPTIKSYVSMKLMQWSITHQNSIERSWNQIYFEFQNIIMDHSLWRAYPKELSVELCERSKKESILGLEILQKQMSNLTTLYYENFHHLEADLFVKEKSLLKTRLQMLSHFQIPLEVQNHLFQVESLMRHHTNLICLSEAWMHMGLAFVKLATPTLPLDPASRFKLSHENALEWQAKLKLELEAFELLQYRDNNKHKNDITDWITEKLPEIKKLILESGRQLYLRPENAASHLNALFSSIRNLFSMLFDPKSLLISFKSMTSMGSFQEQLIVTRQSFISFIENSRKNFSLFMDMLEPIYTGIYDIFHGFNLLSVHDHHQPLTAKEEILQTLPWMKPGCFYALLEKHLNFENDEETIDICTILLENLATYQYLNPFFKINPSLIFKLLNPLIAKFSLMKEKEAIEKKESMKSFKYASSLSVQILDDESDKEWLDIENDSEHLTSLEQSISYVGNNAFMSTELNESLHESRSNLFIADCTVSKKKLNDWMNRSFFAFQNFFGNIKFENAVQEAHCREGIPKFSNSTLHHLLSLIKCSSAFSKDVDPVAYDFYRSPNLPEVLRLVPILTKLDFKIKTLLEDWPEHDVLQQILTIVYRISTFPSHLPLRKFLESLEILLGKCDEWQKYASSSVSLKESIQEISSLIVHWRKLEMKNWRSLLDWYDLEKIKEGATLWLHLLSLLSFVEGVTESELILSLDEYFMGSTLGQFPLRIQILSSLTSHFNIPVIDNVLHYYSEFLPFVQSALNNGRTLIESELKDFVKIAGWHDVNVYSLKVSAQKNRKQLKKCLKKYKELLGRPLAPMLKEKGTIYFAEQRTILKEKTSCKASNLAISMYPEHILHLFNESCTDWIQFKDAQLDRIFMKSTTLIKRHISLPNTLESISNDVIEQIVAFKSETDKITDPITKQESSFLLQCRKKAFSDFLKRFKEMGLVWHHSVPVEVSTLMASPHVPSSNSFSFNSLLNSSKAYRSRVASYLPFIIVNKSPDLEPRQAERLLGYVMDLLKHTLAESSYLAPVCKHLIDVQNLIQTWTSHGNLSFISKEWVESKTFFSLQTDLTSLIAYIKQLLTLNTVSLNSKRYLEALNSKLLKYFGLWNVNVQSHFSMKYFSGTLFKAWENEKKNIIHEIQNTLCLSSRDALFMQPILETLSHPFEKIALSLETHLEFLFFEELEKFIEMIMIQIQHLYAFNGLNYGLTFKSLHSDILSLLSKLNLNFVEKFFDVYFSKLSPELQHHLSRRLLPLLQNYANYLHDTLHEIFVHQKSLSKCTYVLCTNAFRLIQKGYCVPFNTNESQEENDDISGQGLEGADGTGIGQGEGKKDVSNEIENEGQIEGLMGEEEYQPENFKENQNDEGIEMEQDFQGKLEDLKLDGGERNSQNENDDSNLESEDEVEEMDMMNQVDSPESHQVDPTLWDEESDDEKEMREAENIEPSPVHRNPHEVETLEDSQNLEVEPLSKEAPTSDNMEGHLDEEHNLATEDIDKTPDENVGDKENTDENEGKENDEDMDTSKTDADMNLRDEAIKRPQESTESEINLEEMGDEPLDFEEDIKDQDDFDKSESDVVNDDVDMEANSIHEDSDHEAELNPNDDSVLDTDKENKNESEEKLESPAKNANVKQDDVYGTEKKDVNGDEAPLEKEEVENEEKNCQTEQQSTVAGHSSLNKGEDDAIDRTTEMADHQGPSQQNVNDSKCVNSEMQPPQPDNTSKPSDITPSLVEDIKAWKRRLKIAEQTLLSEDPNVQNMENDSPYEKEYTYLQDDDQEMEGDEQTLSAAEPNQTRELPFSLEKEVEEKDTTYQESMTVPPGLGAQEKSSPPNNSSGGSLAPEDEMKVQMFARPHIQEPLSLEEEQECRRKLLDQVEVWRDQNRDVTSSMELWHGCKNLTLLYATQLTEQLRLLLEPTLASHLTGDYKSGKRLNMRRILPYIASDFRKDKIWLRRTKANQRDYQVLIAVDDSQSMNDSSAIQLAFESVCLITRAMEQLEVGPIALCSFGEDLKVVHPFGQRFTDDAGAQAFQRFQFNQSRTNIEALLQSSLHLFQETNSQNIPWRLMLILSDGICDHHEKLRHLVRKAAEARILTVCIVLDQREESILQMSSVNFDNGQLRMTHYMDNFPFDFYVVLRDIRRLPMVLSDALRQFFTLSTST